MPFQEAFQPPSALQVACIEVKRQGQYQSFAYPTVSEYSSEILPLETLHACLTEGTMLKTTQALTSYKIPKEHLLWVPYATLCMLLQNRISLVYIYTKQHYRGWYQQDSFSTSSRVARTFPLMLVYNATYFAVLQHHVVVP